MIWIWCKNARFQMFVILDVIADLQLLCQRENCNSNALTILFNLKSKQWFFASNLRSIQRFAIAWPPYHKQPFCGQCYLVSGGDFFQFTDFYILISLLCTLVIEWVGLVQSSRRLSFFLLQRPLLSKTELAETPVFFDTACDYLGYLWDIVTNLDWVNIFTHVVR